MHLYDNNRHRENINSILLGANAKTCTRSMSNKWGRLDMSNKYGVKSIHMIEFITKERIRYSNKVAYANFIWNYRPLKSEPHRIKLVAGGHILDCDGDTEPLSVSLITTKALLNSIISDTKQGAKFMSRGLKYFFFATPMYEPEFMKIHYKYIRENMTETNLSKMDIHVCQNKKGLYRL